MYRFIAEIKAALVSYLFPARSHVYFQRAFFQFCKQIIVGGAKVLAVRRFGQQLPIEEYVGFRKKIQNLSAKFEKCSKVLHPLKAGFLTQISVPPA